MKTKRIIRSKKKIKRKGDSLIRDALVICGITLIAGLLLGFVYQVTMKPISKAQIEGKKIAYQTVYPDAKDFLLEDDITKKLKDFNADLKDSDLAGNVIQEVKAAQGSDGEKIGYVFLIDSKNGYGGMISITLGMDLDGTITGLAIVSMNETAGLGAKCTEDEFKNQYTGIQAEEIIVTKDGKTKENEIDAITGATITSKAVTNAVNSGLSFYQLIK